MTSTRSVFSLFKPQLSLRPEAHLTLTFSFSFTLSLTG